MDSFEYLSKNAGSIYMLTFSPIIRLLPQFDLYNPTKYLVDARLVGWEMVAGAIFWMICVKAVIVSVIGWLIFRYREIAKITV
jgi:hypothetical protein